MSGQLLRLLQRAALQYYPDEAVPHRKGLPRGAITNTDRRCYEAGPREGDRVVIMLRLKVSLLLRPATCIAGFIRAAWWQGGHWKIVRPCYVEGIMTGEVLKASYET